LIDIPGFNAECARSHSRGINLMLKKTLVKAGRSSDFARSSALKLRSQPRSPPRLSIRDYESLARARLPKMTFDYLTTGSADELTMAENVAAFQRLKILPPVLTGVSESDLTTTVLKQRIAMPIMLAPVAAQALYHPEGALAAARAAASADTVFAVSSNAGNSIEEIAAASSGPKWYQLYAPADRAQIRTLVERVEASGYQALVITVDLGAWKDADRRNRFQLPKKMLLKHLNDLGFVEANAEMTRAELQTIFEHACDKSMSWEFFDYLRSVSKLPLVIKGILRPEDARKAVAIGLDGIIVSNHGGRRLDGVPASIECLGAVAEAAGGKTEIFLDSGVRRGTDVLKALALGARAVLIGRPYAWALAANGEDGVRGVLDLLSAELRNAMLATGCPRVQDIHSSLIRGEYNPIFTARMT
jgi:4-hydroxymandelate oxidase